MVSIRSWFRGLAYHEEHAQGVGRDDLYVASEPIWRPLKTETHSQDYNLRE